MRWGLNSIKISNRNGTGPVHHTQFLSSDQDAIITHSRNVPPRGQASPHQHSVIPFLRRMAYRQIFRLALPLIIAGAFILFLFRQLDHLDLVAVFAMTREVAPHQWFGALIFTVISFMAVGRYDAVVHRMLRTGVPARRASQAGMVAIAVSQTTGFGLFTGALSRFRMLPELTLWKATQMTAVVAVTFLFGWVVAAALTLLFFGAFTPSIIGSPPGLIFLVILIGTSVLLFSLAASLLQPKHLPIPKVLTQIFAKYVVPIPHRIALPSIPPISILFSVLVLTLIDTVAACGALWALLPETTNLDFMTLFPVFLLAFGLGLICGSPAGVGPFEVALFALLPMVADGPLLAGVLAWRMVYYIIPAILGIGALAFGQHRIFPAREGRLEDTQKRSQPRALLIDSAPFAEAALAWQGQVQVASASGASCSWLIGETGQALTALRDPLASNCPDTALQVLIRSARARGKLPCLYKCSARMAQAARKRGWAVFRVAEEAWITPATWDLNTPSRRGLRRKLRKAKKSDVQVYEVNHLTAIEQESIRDINAAWTSENGGERGFSMGRFCIQHLSRQKLFIACEDGRITAFASFHHNQREWALDLMRHRPGCADGTMQALIVTAIDAAPKADLRVSLAAMPCPRPTAETEAASMGGIGGLFLTNWHRFSARLQGQGLRQFKQSFAPNITTLYMAGPGWMGLTLAGFDICRAITSPPEIPTGSVSGKPSITDQFPRRSNMISTLIPSRANGNSRPPNA